MSGPAERSHYQVLGVSQTASLQEIRTAHRQLARVLHPDRLAEASVAERSLAERRMREVNAAWTVLSDPERRRAYDRTLQVQRVGQAASGSGSAAGGAARAPGASRASTGATAGAAAPGSRPWEFDAEYDRSADIDPDEEDLPTWHFWLLRRGPVVAALVLAIGIFVFTAYAATGDGGDDDVGPTTTGLVSPYCARVVEGRNAVPVDCRGPNNGRLIEQVDQPLDCPAGTKYVVIASEFHCVDGDAGQPG